MPDDQELHDRGNGTYDVDRLLQARVQALHAATAWGGHSLAAILGPGPVNATEQDMAAMSRSVLARAEQLERWLLRPEGSWRYPPPPFPGQQTEDGQG